MAVAVIAPFFTRRSFVERLQGVEQVLSSGGYDLILYNVETVSRRDICFRMTPRRERVDGLLVMSLTPTDVEADRIKAAGVPIVLVDACHERVSSVQVDHVAGVRMATQHLIDLGHRRIGYIGEDLENNPLRFQPIPDRFQGYCETLSAASILYNPHYYRQVKFGLREPEANQMAFEMTLDLMTQLEPPTAVIAYSDTVALGVLKAAQHCGLLVPKDLSVIGFDDMVIARYFDLTTIRQPLVDTGRRGAELLLEYLKGDKNRMVEHLILPTELVIRGTTSSAA